MAWSTLGSMSTTQLVSGPTGMGDAFGPVLASVRQQLTGLIDVPTWSLEDGRLAQRFAEAAAVRASADELMARLAAEMDDRDVAGRQGASSTRAHLIADHRMSAAEAGRVMRAARGLNAPSSLTEPTRRALAAGEVSAEQAVVVATAVGRLSPTIDRARVDAAQGDLIDHARRLTFDQLQVLANHLVEVVDPEGADQALERHLESQEARARKETMFVGRFGTDGLAQGRFKIPNQTFGMLKKALDAYGSPRRTNSLVDDRTDEPVTYESRMGLAFCELIEHLPIEGLPQHGVANATLVVTLDEARLRAGVGEAALDTGGTISVSEARRLACNAGILPLVLGGDSKILDLGSTRRFFDRYQRIALATRDRGCIFRGCTREPAWCEAHHLTPWSRGGSTDLDDGCLLCSFHHHLVHLGEWGLVLAPDGIVDVVPPARVDPQRRPMRHERLKPRPG